MNAAQNQKRIDAKEKLHEIMRNEKNDTFIKDSINADNLYNLKRLLTEYSNRNMETSL